MSSPWLKEDGEPLPAVVITAKLDPPGGVGWYGQISFATEGHGKFWHNHFATLEEVDRMIQGLQDVKDFLLKKQGAGQ